MDDFLFTFHNIEFPMLPFHEHKVLFESRSWSHSLMSFLTKLNARLISRVFVRRRVTVLLFLAATISREINRSRTQEGASLGI